MKSRGASVPNRIRTQGYSSPTELVPRRWPLTFRLYIVLPIITRPRRHAASPCTWRSHARCCPPSRSCRVRYRRWRSRWSRSTTTRTRSPGTGGATWAARPPFNLGQQTTCSEFVFLVTTKWLFINCLFLGTFYTTIFWVNNSPGLTF